MPVKESEFLRDLGFPLPPTEGVTALPNQPIQSKDSLLPVAAMALKRFVRRCSRRGGIGRRRVKVRLPDGCIRTVAVRPDAQLEFISEALFRHQCSRSKGTCDDVRLFFRGLLLLPGETVEGIGLGTDDVLDLIMPPSLHIPVSTQDVDTHSTAVHDPNAASQKESGAKDDETHAIVAKDDPGGGADLEIETQKKLAKEDVEPLPTTGSEEVEAQPVTLEAPIVIGDDVDADDFIDAVETPPRDAEVAGGFQRQAAATDVTPDSLKLHDGVACRVHTGSLDISARSCPQLQKKLTPRGTKRPRMIDGVNQTQRVFPRVPTESVMHALSAGPMMHVID